MLAQSSLLTIPIPLPILFLVFSVFVFLLARKPVSHWIGKFSLNPRHAFFLFIQLLIVGVGLDLLTRALGINDTQNVELFAQNLALFPLIGISLIAVSALAEELFFRGLAYTLIGEGGSAILFAVFHLGYGSGVEVVGALLAGIILARGRTQYQSIYPGMAAHLAYNLVAVFLLTF